MYISTQKWVETVILNNEEHYLTDLFIFLVLLLANMLYGIGVQPVACFESKCLCCW